MESKVFFRGSTVATLHGMGLFAKSFTIHLPSLKLTAKARENRGPLEKEIPNLETTSFRVLW